MLKGVKGLLHHECQTQSPKPWPSSSFSSALCLCPSCVSHGGKGSKRLFWMKTSSSQCIRIAWEPFCLSESAQPLPGTVHLESGRSLSLSKAPG